MNETKQKSRFFRASRARVLISCLCVAVLIAVVAINLVLGLIPAHFLKWNVTGNDSFEISQKTEDYLKTIDEDVTLYFISSSGKENEVYLFLSEYAQKSKHLKLQVVDPTKDLSAIKELGVAIPEENMSLIVSSQKRSKALNNSDLYYYYHTRSAQSYTPAEYMGMCQMFETYINAMPEQGYDSVYQSFLAETEIYFNGAAQVSNAINYVIKDRIPKLYLVTDDPNGLDAAFQEQLWLSGYAIQALSSAQMIPADCDLLLIHCLTSDLNVAEVASLDNYLKNGGDLFLTTYAQVGKLPNLNGVLQKYGMSFADNSNYLMEGDKNYYVTDSNGSYPFYLYAHIAPHAATGSFAGQFAAPIAHLIETAEVEGVKVTPWLYTSGSAYPSFQSTTGATQGEKGIYPFGVISEKGDSRVVWVACYSALTADGQTQSAGGNYDLFLSAFDWITDNESEVLDFDAKVIPADTLAPSGGSLAIWAVVLVIVLPLGTLISGIVIWYARKKK